MVFATLQEMKGALWSGLFAIASFTVAMGQFVDPTAGQDRGGGRFTGNPYEREIQELETQFHTESADPEFKQELTEAVERRGFFARVFDENFDTFLPQIQNEGQWSLRFSPKLGDFFDDEYVRIRGAARYNFSDYFEASLGLGTYFGNPFDDGDGAGLYSVYGGFKYTWMDVWGRGWHSAVGANFEIPTEKSPLEITDRYARYEPYVALSHQLEEHPEYLIYVNTSYQFIDNSLFDAEPVDLQPRDQLFVRPGVVYYPGGKYRYSVELEYRTNALDFRNDYAVQPLPADANPFYRPDNWILASREVHEFVVYPGITWFPKQEFREGFFLPGNWDVGLRFELPLIEETGRDFGVSMRFRWYYDYEKLLLENLPERLRAPFTGDR